MSYRLGIVTQIDPARVMARVKFTDIDELVSYWLPVMQAKTLRDKCYWMPDINEHVACLLDENGEEGVILGAIYSEADSAPVNSEDKRHILFDDGTYIEYDRAAHKLTADVKGDVEATISGTLTADVAGNTTLTTPLCTVNGNVKVNGNITASLQIYDLNGSRNSLSALRDVYDSHVHGNSGPPTPQI